MISKLPLTITQIQTGLIKKNFSAVELVSSYLSRIEKHNHKINAFITVDTDNAYLKAKKTDHLLAESGKDILKDYPLLGVATAYKDLYLTKGVRTTAASNVLRDYVPEYSATVVKRLETAGVIGLGKTNCDAWAHGSSGENSDFGPTKNPWNTDYVPGGSSSGSGTALSANMALVTTGTDTCGSIRLPANYNYLYGLKPTYGAVSRYGIIAMASSLDTVGNFGRCVEDIERVFKVIKDVDSKDATLKNHDSKNAKSKIKLGIPEEFFTKGLDNEIRENIMKAVKVLEKAGVEIKTVNLPLTRYAIAVYYILQPAEVSSNLSRYDGIRYGASRDEFGDEAKRRIMLGTYVLSSGYYDAYYLKAMKVRSLLIQEIEAVFKQVDALIAPVAPSAPFKLGEKVDNPLEMYLTDIYAATANLTGTPSLAVPFNFNHNRLPLGFQLMGPRFSEEVLFKLGNLFEKATGYQPKVAQL